MATTYAERKTVRERRQLVLRCTWRTPTQRPATQVSTAASTAQPIAGSSNEPENSARSAFTIQVSGLNLPSTWIQLRPGLQRQQHPGQDQQREQQRLLHRPEHPLPLAHGDGQRVGERAHADPEHAEEQQPDQHVQRVEHEPERDRHHGDQRGLDHQRRQLLERLADQDRRPPQRAGQHPLVRRRG